VHARSRDFSAADGLGKKFSLHLAKANASFPSYSAEMHPRSGAQALYDANGAEIVR